MNTLLKVQIVFLFVMLIGLTWLTVDVFGVIEAESLKTAAIVTWAGLIGSAVCALLRLREK